jgi:mono/diheme cytochrome c family protein
MGTLSGMNRYRKTFTSLGRHSKITARIFPTICFVVLVAALMCSLTRPPTAVVHAYSTETKKSGAMLFHEKGCEHCHGVDGRGGELGPDLSTVGKRLRREQIEHQIREGGAAMPAFGDVLQPDEIKDLVDYLRAKRKAPKKVAPSTQTTSPTSNSMH